MKGFLSGNAPARGLLIRGLVLLALFALAHGLGWREHATILCGMAPVSGGSAWLAAYAGVAYVLCFLLATLLAPVLLIASVMCLCLGGRIQKGDDDERTDGNGKNEP